MKDFLGNTLEVGDEVVHISHGRSLGRRFIHKITAKTIFLSIKNNPLSNHKNMDLLKQTPDQVIKIQK